MKRISFFLFAMLISSMSLFTSCGDDDDDDTTASGMVAGTYDGTLVVSLEGQQVGNESKSLALVKNGDNAVDVVIKNFKLTYIIHSGFISGYQNRYGDNLKPPTNVYHRMTA